MASDDAEYRLLTTEIKDKEHLQNWIEYFVGFRMPDCKLMDHSTSTPLDFIWESYQAMQRGESLHITAIAGRDSGKTVALSIIDLLALIDGRDVAHLGMIRTQAQRAKDYLEQIINRNPVLKKRVVKQNSTEIKLKIADDIVGIETLTMSVKAVQGKHVSCLSMDEIGSSLDPVNLKAYRDAAGMPGNSKSGKSALVLKISSRQSGFSLVEKAIQDAPKTGEQIRFWTTLDCTERCDDKRSGTEDLPLWINIKRGEKYDDQEFGRLPANQKEGFVRTTLTKKNCKSCPLAAYCGGKLRHQTSTSPLLRKIDDVVGKINASGASTNWVLSQLMSMQPSTESLVYHEFSPEIHVRSYPQLFEILTGIQAPPTIDRQQFILELKRRGCQFYAGIDFGYASPAVVTVVAVDGKDRVYVVESFAAIRKNDDEFAEIVATEIEPKYGVQMYVADSESPSGISLLRSRNLPVSEAIKGAGSVRTGLNVVKAMLRMAGTNNETRIYFCPELQQSNLPNTPGLIEEFGLYQWSTDAAGQILDDKPPMKGSDHHCDSLRYVLSWLFGKTKAQATFATPYEPTVETNNLYGPDLIRAQGLYVNDNRDQFDSQGRPKKKPGDDDPDDGGGSAGGGLVIAWT